MVDAGGVGRHLIMAEVFTANQGGGPSTWLVIINIIIHQPCPCPIDWHACFYHAPRSLPHFHCQFPLANESSSDFYRGSI